jgi:hypothetical protein
MGGSECGTAGCGTRCSARHSVSTTLAISHLHGSTPFWVSWDDREPIEEGSKR